jgi:hypothetical protein
MKNLKISIWLVVFVILSCNNDEKNNSARNTVVNKSEQPQRKIEIMIFRNDTIPGSNLTGFGYDIHVDGNPYVHQPHVPAVSGLKGFLTEEDARKAAEYVSRKFEMTNSLPRVSKEELDSLGIKY